MNLLGLLGLDAASSSTVNGWNSAATRSRPSLWPGVFIIVTASAILLYAVFLLDAPIARFVRSVQHPLGYLPNPWLARISSMGDWLGSGLQLVLLSLGFWVVGRWLKWKAWEHAGVQSLLAHGAAALLANALKYVLGRPRPKFSHAGGFQLWPSFEAGFDSFPSGHTSASFAVATVLAVRLPRTGWLWYGIASLIGFSRVVRGSHFPTDVLVGAALGLAVGWVLSHPLRDCRQSMGLAIVTFAPWLVAIFVALRVATRPTDIDGWTTGLFMGGVSLTLTGMAGRILLWQGQGSPRGGLQPRLWNYVIGSGLLLATASGPAVLLGGMVLAGRWWCRPVADPPTLDVSLQKPWRLFSEAALAAGLLLSLIAIKGLHGLFPIQ